MTVPERIDDMLARHGEDSPNARAHSKRGPYLVEAARRVARRLETKGLGRNASSADDKCDVVGVAVAPVLSRFGGADDGVASIAGVGRRACSVSRRSSGYGHRVAHAEVHPPTAAREKPRASRSAVRHTASPHPPQEYPLSTGPVPNAVR
jgi:hypothetical protein